MKNKKLLFTALAIAGTMALASCDINSPSKETPSESLTPSIESSSTLAPSTTIKPSLPETSTKLYLGGEHTAPGLITPEYILSNEPTDNEYLDLLSDKGYAGLNDSIPDFTTYENTASYRKVKTFEEFLDAIADAKYHYDYSITNVIGDSYIVRSNCEKSETNWNNALAAGLYDKVGDSYVQIPVGTTYPGNEYYNANRKDSKSYYEKSSLLQAEYTQSPSSGYTTDTFKGSVRVIEIENDIDLGWNHIPAKYKSSTTYAQSWADSKKDPVFTKSKMYEENGISKIKIENTNDLLIFSKNGSKLTHAGFSIQSSNNIVFRNIEMDEIWQWEDSSVTTTGAIGDYDAYGWAYMKIGFCGNVWIDHCTFGKSFDGQIDVSNPTYTSKGTVFRAPYGADGTSGVHISWCKFNGGSDDTNGYLYKMMRDIEDDYKNNGGKYQYYKALRDGGLTFDEILYGIAIPQKKAFLDGDSGDEYIYNTNLRVSIANCYFRNIEDRLPKVRSGVAYMYNTIIDNYDYYSYRTTLKAKNAAALVSKVNSSWKCGLVSQGIVCGNGGSVALKNCILRGIDQLLKNNDSTLTNKALDPHATKNGGYLINNTSYQKTPDEQALTSNFPNATPDTLKEDYFTWRTNDDLPPFEVENIDLKELFPRLLNTSCGVGVNANLGKFMLNTKVN